MIFQELIVGFLRSNMVGASEPDLQDFLTVRKMSQFVSAVSLLET